MAFFVFSPDGREKLFAENFYFFLTKKSDPRSSFFVLEKNKFSKKLETYGWIGF
jgi:hypothetical protein